MYNINSDEWKRLGEEIDRRGGDGREVVKIGANVTSETRNLERWVMG